ncbi:MAG: low molecular weight phosphotyrosine protein phosphatase [Rickettsiales bacterium]|nr:low molecular weight phosphotyrosine protein phosphatase [Rickettsiales bacterium]
MIKVLFVCTGNICRSPTAHAIANHVVKSKNLQDEFYFDSAATDGFHVGELPDFRSVEVGKKRGIDFSGIFSRKFQIADFEKFDYIMCMDKSHQSKILGMSEGNDYKKVKLFLEFCEVSNAWNNEVKDPYYRYEGAFDDVFDVVQEGIVNMIDIVRK